MSSTDQKNESVIEEVREVFTPLTENLGPEVEPATVFSLESEAGE